MNKELLIELFETVALLLKEAGMSVLSKKILRVLESEDEDDLCELYEELEKWTDVKTLLKNRIIEFGDNGSYSMIKYYIVTFEKIWNDDGAPTIVINKLAEDGKSSFKDNPIKNLYLVYEDEETRDRDIDKIRMTLK